MNENPSQTKTIAAGATGAAVGSKVYGYCIRAAAADVTVEFIETDASGTVLWTDVLDITLEGLARPFAFQKALGRPGTGPLWCVVTGTGGNVDVQYD